VRTRGTRCQRALAREAAGRPGHAHARPAGGQGQYGRVIGYMEPLPEDAPEKVEFAKEIIGNAIPPTFIPACEKGFREAANSGTLIGHPVEARARGRRRAAAERRRRDSAAHLFGEHLCA
jgi:translation elongation factor EF-G